MTGTGAMQILVVCTANICRSPAMERLLRDRLKSTGIVEDVAVISSAGLHAHPDSHRCEESILLVDRLTDSPADRSTANPLKLTGIVEADLILTAERAHRAAIVQAFPLARPYTFTLRQAAEIARGLTSGPLPTAVRLPAASEPAARLKWFIDELDAGRGPSMSVDTDDVPDPHQVRDDIHADSIEMIDHNVSDLAAAVGYVLSQS